MHQDVDHIANVMFQYDLSKSEMWHLKPGQALDQRKQAPRTIRATAADTNKIRTEGDGEVSVLCRL